MLRVCVNLFWLAFLADGALSLVDEKLSMDSPLFGPGLARSLPAFLLLVFSLVMAGMVALSPRVPKRVVVPLILFVWWAGSGMAFPLGYGKTPALMSWLAAGQILLGAGVWLLFRSRTAGVAGPFALRDRPEFRWKYTLMVGPAMGFAAVAFAVLSLLSGLTEQVESISGGYVRIKPDGIYLIERQFQSKDNEVRLTGMMHLAQDDFYSDVLPKADPAVPSIVLVEGVTDHRRLLSKMPLQYSRLARLLKVTAQDESEFTKHVVTGLQKDEKTHREERSLRGKKPESESEPEGIDFKHTDVDAETFHPTTIAFILTVTSIFQSEDLRSVVKALADPNSPLNDEKAQRLVLQDILHSRNERLVAEIDSALKNYRRVIVPWGALHLPEIESWLRRHDFVQCDEVERKALSFW